MRKRAVRMILSVVTVVALLMGIPGAISASILEWRSEQRALDIRVASLAGVIDRRVTTLQPVNVGLLDAWSNVGSADAPPTHTRVTLPGRESLESGEPIDGLKLTSRTTSPANVHIVMEVSAIDAIINILLICLFFLSGVIASLVIAWMIANRLARRLSAPLIYLSAQAEQIGSGQVRARVRPSGIEEIDLVQEELVRTGERMAGRLAAERQFAADASHQLRTPLTALSMRLEEIEMIATDDEVKEEARTCLEQVERMTEVLGELLDANARSAGQTEAIHILEVFNTQREEWEEVFEKAGRDLVFTDEAARPILADGTKLGQVLATLIENSLHYGAGITRVVAKASSNNRGVTIDVSDEGKGVDPELAPVLFEYGVSGHGSTGIGLALSKDLANAMGARLELVQETPPVFRVSVASVPATLDPDRVMPVGPLVSMGRRSRRF